MSKTIPDILLSLWTQGMKINLKERSPELQFNRQLAAITAPGEYYYYVFNLIEGTFDFISEETNEILGYSAAEVTPRLIVENIHPDDLPWFLAFENTVLKFFGELPINKLLKYKVRYDYRLRRKDGCYTRILQQVVTLNHDENGKLLQTLGSHTDISHLKSSNKMTLSFIGLGGEPSYIDVDLNYKGLPHIVSRFSSREREIIECLSNGLSSEEAAAKLGITTDTVNTYRRKLLKKTGSGNVAGLVRFAIEKGVI